MILTDCSTPEYLIIIKQALPVIFFFAIPVSQYLCLFETIQ